MNWYKLNEDHTTEMLPKGEFPDLLSKETFDKKRVGLDIISGQEISTVFLQLDHNWDPNGQPVLFETMIFGGEYDGEMWRYCTWDEALEGHNKVVNCLKEYKNPKEIE